MKQIRDVVVVAYGRSPITRATRGKLSTERPTKFATEVLKGVLARVEKLPLNLIDDVIVGCAMPEDVQGLNVARIISQKAGIPNSASAMTINRFCSSGLQSIALGANAIMAHQADVVVAGGVESMTMCPMSVVDLTVIDPGLKTTNPLVYTPMGMTAEMVAAQYGVTRTQMDEFAVESHQKAHKAQSSGAFEKEIIPVTYTDQEGKSQTLTEDDGIRTDNTVESLSKVNPAFKEDGGLCTAANSSPMNDGAAFVVLMSAEKAKELDIKPIAKYLGYTTHGCSPIVMGMGPVEAVPKLMKMIDMTVDQFDVIELNEAFAAQAIPCIDQLKLDRTKVNPRGGALALGHPLGATGAILTCKALSYLEDTKGKYALISMCIGGGMGAAGAFEML